MENGYKVYLSKKVVTDIINEPREFTKYKDIVTGCVYYKAFKNGKEISWCDLETIEIIALPNRVNYIEGMIFNPEGMVIEATLVDGSVKEITEYKYREDTLEVGISEVEIYCTHGLEVYTLVVNINVEELDKEVKDRLIDFEYVVNEDQTYTLTGWKGTYKGEVWKEMILPEGQDIILL